MKIIVAILLAFVPFIANCVPVINNNERIAVNPPIGQIEAVQASIINNNLPELGAIQPPISSPNFDPMPRGRVQTPVSNNLHGFVPIGHNVDFFPAPENPFVEIGHNMDFFPAPDHPFVEIGHNMDIFPAPENPFVEIGHNIDYFPFESQPDESEKPYISNFGIQN